MTIDATTVPLDERSAAALAERGLAYRTVDAADEAASAAFGAAVGRGFLGERATPEAVAHRREGAPRARQVGVFDDAGPEPTVPVATTDAWVMDVTTDVGRSLPMWSISGVTVSSTHRRRGVARALLEGELRAAAGAGIPIAGLTVSEATIYGRYGFGTAVHTGTWRIDAKRAGWRGPRPTEGESPLRLDHVEREAAAADLVDLNERTRLQRPGDISGWPRLWLEIVGLRPGKPDAAVRAVRCTDADGIVRGIVVYTVSENPEDFTRSPLDVKALVADGTDAYAALWRYLLEHDLIGTITTSLRSLDEPLRWMVADQRALTVTERDHHWLRVLDVPACLQARRYRVPGAVHLVVADDLGFAEGTWSLVVDAAGEATVEQVADDGAGAGPGIARLGVADLSAMLLGGVRASILRAAGQIDADEATAAWLDLALAPAAPVQLSYWY